MICNWLWLKTAIVVLLITSRNVTFFLISSLVSGVLDQLQNFWQLHLIEFLGLKYGTIWANVLDIYKAFDRLSVVCWSSSQTQIFWNFRSDCWHYFTEIWGSKWLVNFDFSAGKVQLVCLTSLITMVLLMSKLMGLFLKKNILLRCWNFLSLLN